MNDGLNNEKEIVEALHKKKFQDLNFHWQQEIKRIFPNVINEDIIECFKYKKKIKSDIRIKIANKIINVSIKSGNDISVHSEISNTFYLFLKNIGVTERTIKIIKFYQYGDLTIDGSGKKIIPLDKLKIEYYKYFAEANYEINKPNILIKCIDRFLFSGSIVNNSHADYLFYGNKNFGYFVNKKELFNYLMKNKAMHLSGIHFGQFSFQCASRCIGKPKRKYIQIKWHSFLSDYQKILKQMSDN